MSTPPPLDYQPPQQQPTDRLSDVVIVPYVKGIVLGISGGSVGMLFVPHGAPDIPIGACAIPIFAGILACVAGFLLALGLWIAGFRFYRSYINPPKLWLVWLMGTGVGLLTFTVPAIVAWQFKLPHDPLPAWIMLACGLVGVAASTIILRPRGASA